MVTVVCRAVLVSKKLRESVLFSLQTRQSVSESGERERWRGGEGVGNCVALSEPNSTAAGKKEEEEEGLM